MAVLNMLAALGLVPFSKGCCVYLGGRYLLLSRPQGFVLVPHPSPWIFTHINVSQYFWMMHRFTWVWSVLWPVSFGAVRNWLDCTSSDRQSSVPLRVCVWRRLCHHSDCLPGGRGQNQVHELATGPVQERHQLCLDNDDKRGANSFLQRVSFIHSETFNTNKNVNLTFFGLTWQICALISEAGVVEHRHVCLVRTNQESHDGDKKEDRSQKLKSLQIF